MMRLALAGKCGAERMPLNGFSVLAVAAANASRFSKLNSAAPPRPNANRPKNSRRFIAKLMSVQFIESVVSSSHHGFVEIEQCLRKHRAGRQVHRWKRRIIWLFAHRQQLRGGLLIAGKHLALFLEQLLENSKFLRGRMPRGHQAKYPFDPIVECGATFLQHPFAHKTGGLDNLSVVQEAERMQRSAGALASHDAHIALRRVEGNHRRRRLGSFPECVETGSMQVFAAALAGVWI